MMARRSSRQKHAADRANAEKVESAPILSLQWRLAISCLVVLQLIAVVAEPFRFFTLSSRGTSPAADPARNLLGPYVEFAYLNHGYFFFAPEPGPSHLVDFRFQTSDGERATLRFPDRKAQWPRLLYHRHFMLTENLHQLWQPPLDPEMAVREDPQLAADWRRQRELYVMIRDSMTRHIAARYDASDVQLDRVEHRLPSDSEVLDQRLPLNDPTMYLTLPDAPLLTDPGPMPIPPSAAQSQVPSAAAVGGNTDAAGENFGESVPPAGNPR